MEEPELREACASGDVGRVKACLYLRRAAKGEAILAVDAKQRTPLHLATIHGHVEVVQELATVINNDMRALLALDDKGWAALHHAAANGHMGLCWLLVDLHRRCGVLCKSPGADSALHVFVNNMHRVSGRKEGKSPNNPASLTASSPKQIRKMIRALLTTTGLPIDHQNNAGETALHLACFKGHLLAAEVLCESGASLHIKSHKNSWTCLHFAARAGHMEVVKYLIGKGANPLARGTQGTAADVANQVHETAIAAYLQECMKAYAQVNDYKVDVSCAGDVGVGATSLLLRYADDSYSDTRSPTAECFRLKVEQVDDNEVQLRLWLPTPTKRKDRDAVMVCFDCTSASSYATAAACLDALAKRDCIKVLVATKTDLVASRAVDGNTALALAEQYQIPFFETSAKQNVNVQLPFRHIAQAWSMHRKAVQSQREASPKKGKPRRGTSGA